MNRNCPICSSSAKVIGETLSHFKYHVNVYYCRECDLKFAAVGSLPDDFYDELYSLGDLGYHYDETKNHLPLDQLVYKDVNFAAVKENLPAASSLDVLDVGCGYGYLTNALAKLGHRVKGIDVSGKAVATARELYGDHFEKRDIAEVKGSYDLIVGIEIIEHLLDPLGFIRKAAALLKPGGRIILTTPNKDFYNKNTIWMTNPCPIHLSWFGEKALSVLAERAGLRFQVLPTHRYLMKYDNVNLLVDWLRYHNQKAAKLTPGVAGRSWPKSFLRSVILSKPVKGVSNFLYGVRPLTRTLAVVMTKR